MISIELYFILFGLGVISYFFFIYTTYQYAKSQGYNPSFPGFTWGEFSKFLKFCSKTHKEENDTKLKWYLWSIYFSFFLCTVSMLLFCL